jgi:hypothetical protein
MSGTRYKYLRRRLNVKFMQTVDSDVYRQIRAMAKERGVTVQEFLRAIVLPDWMSSHTEKHSGSRMIRTERKLTALSRT